jgi:hypothetical protein
MPHSVKETIAFAFCDTGTVDARFMDGILSTIFWAKENKINLYSSIRIGGNQIGRQRQNLFDAWADLHTQDWLLWIDSDIVLTPEAFKLVWDAADKDIRPVVSGLYFGTKEMERPLPMPMPILYMEGKNKNQLEVVILPEKDGIIEIDAAGFGFVLMHRSIISKIREANSEYSLFAEEEGVGDKFISEDITFFRKLKKTGIKVYAHTGAKVQHIKRFVIDNHYYNVYWNALEKGLFSNGQSMAVQPLKE